jgi:hypothetical protein
MSAKDPLDADNPYRWNEAERGELAPKSSSKKWWLLGCLPLAALLLCGGACAGLFAFIFGLIKSSEPYVHSLERAKGDPQVVAALGEPIEPGMFPTGSVNLTNDSGDAQISYTIAGPNGSAVVTVEATRAARKWSYQKMEAKIDGSGEVVDLRP